jgi:hypothetical protein
VIGQATQLVGAGGAGTQTSITMWAAILLVLVGLQVVLLTVRHRGRRREGRAAGARSHPAGAAPAAAPPLALLAPARPIPGPGGPDWSVIEAELAASVGPAVDDLVHGRGGEAELEGDQIRSLAKSLASRVGTAHGLDGAAIATLGSALEVELLAVLRVEAVGGVSRRPSRR